MHLITETQKPLPVIWNTRYSRNVWRPSAEPGCTINKQKQYDIIIHLIACQWQAQLCLYNCWVSHYLHVLISHSRIHNHSMTTDRVISKARLLLYPFNSLFLKDTVSYIYFFKRTVVNSFVGLQAIQATAFESTVLCKVLTVVLIWGIKSDLLQFTGVLVRKAQFWVLIQDFHLGCFNRDHLS